MDDELILLDTVRTGVLRFLPDHPGVADRAAAIALAAFATGASMVDARAAASRFVGSWCRHPSHHPVTVDLPSLHLL